MTNRLLQIFVDINDELIVKGPRPRQDVVLLRPCGTVPQGVASFFLL